MSEESDDDAAIAVPSTSRSTDTHQHYPRLSLPTPPMPLEFIGSTPKRPTSFKEKQRMGTMNPIESNVSFFIIFSTESYTRFSLMQFTV